MMSRNPSAYLNAATLIGAVFASPGSVAGPVAAQSTRCALPDFTELYEKQSTTVVSIDVTQKIKRSRLPDLSEDDPFYEFFRRFGADPAPRGMPQRDLEQQSVGSGFIISAATATSSPMPTLSTARTRSASTSPTARVQGQGDRPRQAHRHGAAQDRRQGSAEGHDRRSREAQGRRVGGRDRQAVRPREHDDGRHRERQRPRPAAGEPHPLHPDRRRDQSGQLGRAAVQPEGRSRRHQLAHLLAIRAASWASPSRSRSTSR